MPSALERAKSDLLRLQTEYARAQAVVMDVSKRIEDVSTFIRMAEFYQDDAAEMAVQSRGGTSGAAVNMVIQFLNETGKSHHTRDLIELLKSKGVIIGGKDPVANLSGFLSRSDELRNVRPHGWVLASWDGHRAPAGNIDAPHPLSAGRPSTALFGPAPQASVVRHVQEPRTARAVTDWGEQEPPEQEPPDEGPSEPPDEDTRSYELPDDDDVPF